jgi:predicted O-methyltransferase YrrM
MMTTTEALLVATPNPIPAGASQASTMISWDTRDGSVGYLYVRDRTGHEQIFAAADRGTQSVTWIRPGETYWFSLYDSENRERLLAQLQVEREGIAHDVVMQSLQYYLAQPETRDETIRLLAETLRPHAQEQYPEVFPVWQEHGIHLTPVHFYQPIPDTRTLTDELWTKEHALVGVDMNDAIQLELLTQHFVEFREEYDTFPRQPTSVPHEYYFDNGQFGGTDALVLYCMVRHFKPSRIIEVGSGFSSRVAAQAALKNGTTQLTCIEPYHDGTERHEVLQRGFPGVASLIKEKVEDIDLAFFDRLEPGDMLFIDTSHVSVIGGDVNYLLLDLVPRLKPGVIVHVHDIFLPGEYPKDWVLNQYRFWNEQYLLHGFLLFNSDFEVLFSNAYMSRRHLPEMQATFSRSPWWQGSSFWMRRRMK